MTAIIVIFTPEKITIAADSKETSSKHGETRNPAVKIRQVNSLFFGIAGVSESIETGVNMDDIIHAALGGTDGVEEKIARLKDSVIPALQLTMQYSYDNERKYFDENFNGKCISEIFICGVTEGELFVRKIVFGTDVKEDQAIVNLIGEGVIPEAGKTLPKCHIFSNSAELEAKIMGITPVKEAIETPESVAEKYISAAAKENSDLVGLPIDILEVRITAAKWIQRKEECPDIVPFN